jgi:hypothetical protein
MSLLIHNILGVYYIYIANPCYKTLMVILGGIFKDEQCIIQGGSNMTGTDCGLFTHKSVPVIFESPCTSENTLVLDTTYFIIQCCVTICIRIICQIRHVLCPMLFFIGIIISEEKLSIFFFLIQDCIFQYILFCKTYRSAYVIHFHWTSNK